MGSDTMTAESKRARVRRLLIEPLEAQGMIRQKKMTAGDHKAKLDRLADKLAYLPDEKLENIKTLCVRMAGGKADNEWPDEVSIVKWAWRMQTPPPKEVPYADSLMRSRLGQTAFSEGFHAELFAEAMKLGPPPSKYDFDRMRVEARENRSQRERYIQILGEGRSLTEYERRWLSDYSALERRALEALEAAPEGGSAA